jgi:SAM-dependent methyltransferase
VPATIANTRHVARRFAAIRGRRHRRNHARKHATSTDTIRSSPRSSSWKGDGELERGTPIDIFKYNTDAWNAEVARGNEWTRPVGPDVIAAARKGDWSILLTPVKAIPRDWFPDRLAGVDVLCLASGGGQQGPILAAAGATVTVLDASDAQLARDREVADREGLSITTVQADMADLSRWADATFDLIVNPWSNCFAPDVRPIWRSCYRVLRPGGALLAGFGNPLQYIFDDAAMGKGEFIVRHALPYADTTHLTDDERRKFIDANEPLVFGHTLTDQIAGQTDAGFVIAGFYEDRQPESALSQFTATGIATRAVKPS